MGNDLYRAHRQHFSTERIWGAFDATGLVIEEPQVVVHKGYQPDFLLDFFDADILSGKHLAQVYLAPSNADPPALSDRDGAIVEGILNVA